MIYIENFSKTFNCCGKQFFYPIEYIAIEYWKKVFVLDKKFKNVSFTNEIFGKEHNTWDNVNDLINFWNLMVLMYNEKRRLYNKYILGVLDTEPDPLYFRDKYYLECIRKTLKCKGIDILPLLSLIDLNYVLMMNDGIGYMAVVPNTSTSPDNRIFYNL